MAGENLGVGYLACTRVIQVTFSFAARSSHCHHSIACTQVTVRRVSCAGFAGVSYNGTSKTGFDLPNTALDAVNCTVALIISIVFRNPGFFIDGPAPAVATGTMSAAVGSEVLTVTMINEDTGRAIALNGEVVLRLALHETESTGEKCVFWDTVARDWDPTGCAQDAVATASSPAGLVVCRCNHTTSFAVLTSVTGESLSALDQLALEYITYIGVGVSVPCLAAVVLSYILFATLRTLARYIIMQLSLNLAVGLTLFIAGMTQTGDALQCDILAITTHYFLLVAFCWMLVDGWYLHRTFCNPMSHVGARKGRLWPTVNCYLAPAVIVGASIALDRPSYGSAKACWLHHDGLIWAFVGPVVLVVAINSVLFIRIMQVCVWGGGSVGVGGGVGGWMGGGCMWVRGAGGGGRTCSCTLSERVRSHNPVSCSIGGRLSYW